MTPFRRLFPQRSITKITLTLLLTTVCLFFLSTLYYKKWITKNASESADMPSSDSCFIGVPQNNTLNKITVYFIEKMLDNFSPQNNGLNLLLQNVLICLGHRIKHRDKNVDQSWKIDDNLVDRFKSEKITDTTPRYFNIIIHNSKSNKTKNPDSNGNTNFINTTEYIQNKYADPTVALFLQSPIINPHNYQYIINHPNACNGNDVKYILGVKSAVGNVQKRKQVRQRYGGTFVQDKRNKIIMLFFLGRISKSPDIQNSILEENRIYNDIVQEDFEDIYNNLPIKTAMAMQWAGVFCNHSMSKFMILIDDDLIINPANVTEELTRYHQMSLQQYSKTIPSTSSLSSSSKAGDTSPFLKDDERKDKLINPCFILGKLVPFRRPNRNPMSKYYLSVDDYHYDKLPPFILGGIKGFSSFTASLLFKAYQRVKLIKLEDVYFTGICAPKVGVSLYDTLAFNYQHQAW